MMYLARPAATIARRAALQPATRRAFSAALVCRDDSGQYDYIKPQLPAGAHTGRNMDKKLEDIHSEEDLIPEGANPGTIPSDLEQATGLERLELLGKMQGVDIFDMRPLPSDRKGTLEDPIRIKSAGEEQFVGCTGCPADSHNVIWCRMDRQRPLERCKECGSCYLMEYVGPPDDEHAHHGSNNPYGLEEPKTMADYIKPEYYYR